MSWMILWAAPAAVGFAILFNVRRRALLPVALLAMAGKALQTVLTSNDFNIVFASFLAAVLIGTVAYTLGPATGEASSVYGFAAVIPMVPGSFVLVALQAIESVVVAKAGGVQALTPLIEAATNGITAAAIILSLAIGVTSPMLLMPSLRTPED